MPYFKLRYRLCLAFVIFPHYCLLPVTESIQNLILWLLFLNKPRWSQPASWKKKFFLFIIWEFYISIQCILITFTPTLPSDPPHVSQRQPCSTIRISGFDPLSPLVLEYWLTFAGNCTACSKFIDAKTMPCPKRVLHSSPARPSAPAVLLSPLLWCSLTREGVVIDAPSRTEHSAVTCCPHSSQF